MNLIRTKEQVNDSGLLAVCVLFKVTPQGQRSVTQKICSESKVTNSKETERRRVQNNEVALRNKMAPTT